MSVQVQVPPSERDFGAFFMAKVERRSTREIAGALGISQTRVCQVLESVEEFMLELMPEQEDAESEAKRVNLARWVASKRLDHVMSELMACYEHSKGKVVVERETEGSTGPRTVRTTTTSLGDWRYLDVMSRLILRAAKISAPVLSCSDWMAPSDAEDSTEPAAALAAAEASDVTDPPKGDCSPAPVSVANSLPPAAANSPTSPYSVSVCSERKLTITPGASSPKQTVQPPLEPFNIDEILHRAATKVEGPDPDRRKARRAFLAAAG